ncbi:MAG: PIG-L family deacetylase [Bacteroidota bacterium]|nr:PIG-L family deacetylase [Bacteroidota bacterium]
MRKLFFFALAGVLAMTARAQAPEFYPSSEIYQHIKKLKVLASVLYIAAHPDDENNALLPYLAKGKLYRTAYLSLTRGDGGQNLIGDEQGVELGMMRTEELLAARRIDGAGQYFSRAYEFGYSKSAAEALRIWGKEKILSDVVWVIRKFQPDVIIKRFPPDKRAGHGHHAASSILADEAFTAAADPHRFPEQFQYGVKPWQAKRILWNTYRFGGMNTTSEDQLKIDIGGYNPLIGESFGELGGDARTMHKSQGEGRPRIRGVSYEYFKNLAGPAPVHSLMDGVVKDWSRIPGGAPINGMIDQILQSFDINHPSKSIPALVKLYGVIHQLPEGTWRDEKLKELQDIILQCDALFVEATSSQSQVVQGGTLSIQFVANNREGIQATLKSIAVENFDTSFHINLPADDNVNLEKTIGVAGDKPISQPYWLVHPLKGGAFDVRDQRLIGKAWNDPSFEATFVINIAGRDFTIHRPVEYRYVDPVRGDTYEPIPVLPKVELQFGKTNYISLNGAPVITHLKIKSNSGEKISDYTVRESSTGDWAQRIIGSHPDESNPNQEVLTIEFTPKVPAGSAEDELKAEAQKGSQMYNSYTKVIAYNYIPTITYFPRAESHLVKVDLKTVGKKIGYIEGAGDKVPEALRDMGFQVDLLHEGDLNDSTLAKYDAIITGVRAYNLHQFLSDKNEVLMNFVKHGGNMIVQYMKSNRVGNHNIVVGPYPFHVSPSSRITEEDSHVDFLLPDHPALNYPNKITEDDFKGWIQERSTYQAVDPDPHYALPLGMHDTGESESNGSLAITPYGKGNFVYASLVFFRQLPAGIPGAYRLMANLIALPRHNP